MATEQQYFELFVTCVDKAGPMLKIWGQTDRVTSMFIEQLLRNTSEKFEREMFNFDLTQLSLGLLCCAKYKDGLYYRALITNLRNLVAGSIEVKFIDYGNVELIPIENIRLLQNVPFGLTNIKPQAVDFVLANVMYGNRVWDDKVLAYINNEIAYMELRATIVSVINNYRFINIMFHETDLSQYLIKKAIVVPVPLATQELIFRSQTTPVLAAQPVTALPQIHAAVSIPSPATPQPSMSVSQVQELCSYKTMALEPNSEHMVYVSYVEDGPYLFSIQLQSLEHVLEKLMIDINQLPLLPLTETPIPGYPCMARCLEDESLCRAVVINLVEDKCKTYYVDFGNTDVLPFSHIFQIPFKYMQPKVMSMRFTLAGLKKINVTTEMKCAFKEYVTNKLLKLKVLKSEASPVMQYCELYDGDNNITSILYENVNEFKTIPILKGMKYNVIVSYIQGCKRFFVQLKEYSDSLNSLMLGLGAACETETAPKEVTVGLTCAAFYSEDNQWYRAQITAVNGNSITLKYVDFGNEDTVTIEYLRKIGSNVVKMLPAQAIECCLYGYQNMKFNDEIESVFESLTLECEFTMKVMSKLNESLLVDLFDTSGNNVAALLIEKLAEQKSQISPIETHKITKSILSTDEPSDSKENEKNSFDNTDYQEERQTKKSNQDGESWRSSTKGSSWRNTDNDNKSWRNVNDNKSWRSNEPQSPSDNYQNNFNGDTSDNKKPYQRNDRKFSQNNYNKTDRFSDKRYPPKSNQSSKSDWPSGSDSEKSWSGNKTGKRLSNKKDFEVRSPKAKVELAPQDLAPLEEQFKFLELPVGASENVAISWFYNPEHFFCQLLSKQHDFRNMMTDLQSAYVGRSPLNTILSVGSSVVAEFQEDSVLYRATVVENKHPKYKVQFVDFGNLSVVDCNKIWQVEKKFMESPMQAVVCGLSNVKPLDDSWPTTEGIDAIFNKESFSCTFNFIDGKYLVQLFDDNIDVCQQLIDGGFADSASSQTVNEGVDLNMLYSQNIRVHISYIQGLDKFYVHLEKDLANNVLESISLVIKSADINTLQKLSAEQIIVGEVCVVQIDDEHWRRAIISDISDLNSISVQYPDMGGSEQFSSDKLFVVPSELCSFWYQSFECCLHNLSEDANRLMSDEDFKKNYEGTDLIIYVDDVADGRLVVTLYDFNGTKLELIDPDEGAFPTIKPLCPFPVLYSTLSVWISYVNSTESIYIQNAALSEAISALLELLFEHYESSGEPADVAVDNLCCAKSSDGNWYRGRITEVSEETATVLYVDYGNSETLPVTELRALDQMFYNTHEMALNVGLNVTKTSEEFVNVFNELTREKTLKAVVSFDEGWIVDLWDGDMNLSQKLVELQVATGLITEDPMTEPVKEPTEEPVVVDASPVDDTQAKIIITHTDSPSEFYVQLASNQKLIEALQSDLQQRVLELPDLENADVGVLCAAKYSVDEQWYRAEVLDADTDITTVRFVDYGNTDVITNNVSSIKTLPADLLSVDKYARKCSLNLMPNKGDEWAQEACEIFENAVYVEEITANIIYQDEKNKTFVDLFANGQNVADLLEIAQLAVPIVRDAEDNIANNTGFVSHLNSVSEFWIQLESSVPDLEMIVDRLICAEEFPDLQDLSPGILCAANFPDDEMWYRARILSNTVAGVEVLFVDYGNSSTAMKLKTLPEDLLQMPPLAQKCSLFKPQNISAWLENSTDKFREISADGVTIFTVKKLTPGETSVVELFVDGVSISEQLVEFCSSGKERESPVGKLELVKVHVTHTESPAHFWVQFVTDSAKIDEIMENLKNAQSFEPVINWDADTSCAALYADSGLWYRAKVIDSQDDQFEVLLVDYGNTLKTNELRILPEEIATIPPLATLCSLHFPEGVTEWTSSVESEFLSLVADGYADYQVEFLNNEVPSEVKLFINNRNIAELLFLDEPQNVVDSTFAVSIILETISLAVNTKLPEPTPDAPETDELEELTNDKDKVTDNAANPVTETNEVVNPVDDSTTKYEPFSDSKVESDTVSKDEQSPTLTFNNALTKTEIKSDSESSNDLQMKGKDKQRIIPGGTVEVSLEEDAEVSEIMCFKTQTAEAGRNRSPTPYSERIVPGAVSRGDLEVPPDEDPQLETWEDKTKFQSAGHSRPATPYDDKIVSGSVCGADVKMPPNEDSNTKMILAGNIDFQSAGRSRTATPYDDKILSGSVYGCDLTTLYDEHPEKNAKIDFESTSRRSRSATPYDDKIVSGSVCGGNAEMSSDEDSEVQKILDNEIISAIKSYNDKIVPESRRGNLEISPDEDLKIKKIFTDKIRSESPIRNRSLTPKDDRIVPGAICRGDLELPPITDPEVKKIFHNIESLPTGYNRSATTYNEKIVPGSVCRGDLELLPNEKRESKKILCDVESLSSAHSRSATPYNERIVPGSICRGDLELLPNEDIQTKKILVRKIESQSADNSRSATPYNERIVPGSICRGDLEFPPEDLGVKKVLLKSFSADYIRPATPYNEKIVPGSICRGDLEMPPDEDPEIRKILLRNKESLSAGCSRSVTPYNERIVPGSICRGDLELPFEDKEVKKTLIRSFSFEHSRPATPYSEKIVPGSVSRGDLELPPDEDPEFVVRSLEKSISQHEENKIHNGGAKSEKIAPESALGHNLEGFSDTLKNNREKIETASSKKPESSEFLPSAISRSVNIERNIDEENEMKKNFLKTNQTS